MNITDSLRSIVRFYVEGFRQMTWGRTLWILILAKLFVLFFILRPFFFRPALSDHPEEEKPEAVATQLLKPCQGNTAQPDVSETTESENHDAT